MSQAMPQTQHDTQTNPPEAAGGALPGAQIHHDAVTPAVAANENQAEMLTHPDMAPLPAANENEPPMPNLAVPAPAPATGIAGWLQRHRNFTKEPVSYTAYQFGRATIAVVPYGFGMAFGHHLFGLMSAIGQKIGLTKQGIDVFTNGEKVMQNGVETLVKGLPAVDRMAAYHVPGMKGVIGRNMMRLGNSPLNAAVQIAIGFTLFRFTGGLIKNLRDRVMNEKNTDADTAYEVKRAPHTIMETARINWPAESTATPVAALVLGFMNAAFTPSAEGIAKKLPGEKFEQAVGRVWSGKSKLLQNMAVWTLSYSLFFLLAESLFKDKQISRGLWKGHPNSLKNGPDDIVGGPGAVNFQTPENETILYKSAEGGYEPVHPHVKDEKDEVAKDSHQPLRFPFFTGEPSMGRFIIRRVLPVAVGISAYAALKRVGYIAEIPKIKIGNWESEMLSGPMKQMTVGELNALHVEGNALKTVGNHGKEFFKNAVREGKATTMFGALWWATDAAGSFYDKFFHNLQKKENEVPLNDNQQAHHAELLGRLNEKYQNQGRAA